ncbi:hypothetical protein EYR41_008308 [Orbilia oligospora]|uniref:Uncharacterized protein n=1 Tax=Orbilia oligospora TaxID=2813651 RepID=A0A7C8KD35_ORBOL|nr:hypothetical protein TWF751_011888 [Orbilia oligospora]TGJ66700.1 hypothetical protein EYR41_008308 [Orbilia oligospora]
MQLRLRFDQRKRASERERERTIHRRYPSIGSINQEGPPRKVHAIHGTHILEASLARSKYLWTYGSFNPMQCKLIQGLQNYSLPGFEAKALPLNPRSQLIAISKS